MTLSQTQSEATNGSPTLIDRLFRAPVDRHVLDNGLTLVHRPDFSSEVVSVQVWVKTGSIHEDTLIGSGLSHYLEHMLFKGTERRDGKAISREVHAMGGGINAYTTFDRTVYYIDAPAAAFDGAVDVLADIVLHSTLPEAEVERERGVILREIDMGLDDPDRQLSQALFRRAYQRHPYREPVIGHRSLFEQVSRQELFDYYKARYVPNNIVVSIVGAISSSACLEAIQAHFGSVPRGRLAPVQIQEEPVQLAARREDIVGEYNIFRGGLGFKVPHLSDDDSPCLDALALALGGGESSLLWERLRNQQKLVHYIDCRNWNPGGSGLFWISYVCDSDKQNLVESAVRSVIQEVCEQGLAESVVEKAQRQALSAEINGRKTMSGQASRLGLGEVVIGDIHYGRRYLKRLESVTAAHLQRVAVKYLVEDTFSAVTLGPEATSSEQDDLAEVDALVKHELAPIEIAGGVRLLLQPDHRLPKVHLRAVLFGGPMYEPAKQRGVSALLAELLTKDTIEHSAAEVSELIESIGGKFSASGGNNTLNLSLEVLPSDLQQGIDLLTNALTCPTFDPDTFATELEGQIAGLKEEDDEILDYGFRLLRERFFGEHPLAIGSDGRLVDLEGLDRQAVVEHYKTLVTTPNLVLSVCGDFDVDRVREGLEAGLVGKLSGEPVESPTEGDYEFGGPSQTVEAMEREQAVVLQAFPDVGVQQEDFVVGEMMNELLSGMSSRLFERVREDKGMAYYVGSTRVLGLQESMFVLYAGTHPDMVDEVLEEMNAELARIAAGDVLEDELDRCRTRLKAARPMGRQTIGARAMHAAINLTYGLPLDDDVEHAAEVDAVDAAELARFATQYLTRERMVQLVVQPES